MQTWGECLTVDSQRSLRSSTIMGWQAAFVGDDVSNIIKESIDMVLQNQQYNQAKVIH